MPTPIILCSALLAAWLLLASWTDLRQRRIPNALVLTGMLCGMALQSLTNPGQGLFAFWWGGLGCAPGLFLQLAGLALCVPLHLLLTVAAGDVKLCAMVVAGRGLRLRAGPAPV